MLKYSEESFKAKFILNKILSNVQATYPPTPGAGPAPVPSTWTLIHRTPATGDEPITKLIIQGTSKVTVGGTPTTKDYYVMFTYDPTSPNKVSIQIAEELNTTLDGIVSPLGTGYYAPVLFESSGVTTNRTGEHSITLCISITNQRIVMMASADPSVELGSYRKSFCYIGAISPFVNYESTDANDTGILVTAGAETFISDLAAPNTAVSLGNTTFQVLKTKTGNPLQKHYPAFITPAPDPTVAATVNSSSTGLALLSDGFNASAWTNKYHMSPIYVVHPIEGYRGTLDGCLAVVKNRILNRDQLIVDIPTGTPGKTWNKEYYTFFDIDTKYDFMNYSPNVKMGLAFLTKLEKVT